MPQLRATYRLQLNRDFTFSHATALVPYLARLGISHLYLSPILMARPGSMHGYDTVDHGKLNPELGSREDFEALAGVARERGVGLIVDFVPNHMGIGTAENRAWQDVLTHGKSSAFAHWFDINFDAGPIRVPVLDRPLAAAIAAGMVRLEGDLVMAGETPLPLRPEDRGSTDLASVLERQHWRLIHYARAADELNYRRFFAISDLAGLRIEDERVFAATHKLLIELAESGLIDGVRIDHIDGLRDPTGYLERLRRALPERVFIHVEKILGVDEALPDFWDVAGTTGYEALSQLTNLFIGHESERILNEILARMGGDPRSFQTIAREAKNEVMSRLLAVEMNGLARLAERAANAVPDYVDLTAAQFSRAIRAVVAELDIYRSYLRPGQRAGAAERVRLERALAAARTNAQFLDPRLFDFLEAVLIGRGIVAEDFLARWQQFTGPVMAKGVEDTALYRHMRLLALNDVGADPDRFGLSVEKFHAANRERLAHWPDSLLATSTHDTKRGEDTRMRILGAADDPQAWDAAVTALDAHLLRLGGEGVHAADRYVLLQSLLGIWPFAGGLGADAAARLAGAMEKSLREAGLRSNWNFPVKAYEDAMRALVHAALGDAAFLARFAALADRLAPRSARKALAALVLKLTIPGVPDIYRGAEIFEHSLVDPDNRRTLDFGLLAAMAEERVDWSDPRVPQVKLALTRALLGVRSRHEKLFARGRYEPFEAGARRIGFERRHGDEALRVTVSLAGEGLAGAVVPEGWREATGAGLEAVAALGFVVLVRG